MVKLNNGDILKWPWGIQNPVSYEKEIIKYIRWQQSQDSGQAKLEFK